jgi:hypothetical protein
MTCIQDIAALFKDLATIFAAVVAAIVAIKGYNSWKKQLRGKTEHDLARRLLLDVYRVRNAIQMVREPFISEAETWQAIQEARIQVEKLDASSPQYAVLRQQAVYARRWSKVLAAFEKLEVDALEAEVLWGQTIVDSLVLLRQYTKTLQVGIWVYLRNLSGPTEDQEPGQSQEALRIIHSRGQDDRFADEIKKAVEEVQNTLRPYLSLE